MFQLTAQEKSKVVTICDHPSRLKFSRALPLVFTEHGAIIAASLLNSPRAVEMSVFVVRAFVRLRQALATPADLTRKLADLEKKYDVQFKVAFAALRALMNEPNKKKKPIGFTAKEASGRYKRQNKGRSNVRPSGGQDER